MAQAAARLPEAVMTVSFAVEEERHWRRRCGVEPGMPVRLVLRRTRRDAPPRVAVLRPPGVVIGFVPADVTPTLARVLEHHEPYDGYVSRFEDRSGKPTPVIVVRLAAKDGEEDASRPEWRGPENPWVDWLIVVSFLDILGFLIALVVGLALAIRWVFTRSWARGGDDASEARRQTASRYRQEETEEAKRALRTLVMFGVLLSIFFLVWLAVTG